MSSRRQPGKIFSNSYCCELVHARAARHDHRLDVEVVERVRDAVEQHAVVGDDLLPSIVLAGGGLRIAAAQVARRQHASARRRDRASPASRGPPARTAAPSRSPGNRTRRPSRRLTRRGIADDRHDRVVLDVEQRARGALRQPARHRLVDEVDHLRLDRGAADRRGRCVASAPARGRGASPRRRRSAAPCSPSRSSRGARA